MQLKPFRDYSEHDVVNLFAVQGYSSLPLGTLVTITGSGWVNNANWGIAYNINPTTNAGNVYTPRWEVKSKVIPLDSGSNPSGAPLGFTLYDVLEYNFQGVSFLYDPTRKEEAQAVVSGEAVPIARKGLFLVGGFPTGAGYTTPAPGLVTVPSTTGSWAVAPAGTKGAFGLFLGGPDADGYSLVAVDFNQPSF
jgi:hypothetical protein